MRFFGFVFTLLLIYVLAALIFWGHSLQKQSRIIYEAERQTLHFRIDSTIYPVLYAREADELEHRRDMRRSQYYGEGITLGLILLAGAAVVYSSLQRRVRLQKQQNNFMLAVTHELKSPIAGMKLSLQTLQRHNLTDAQRAQLLNRGIQESDRLDDLANNMLITSQIEGRQYKNANEAVDLSELAESSADVYAQRLGDRFVARIEDDCRVTGDQLLLQMAMHNLLENAIKYTPAEATISLTVSKRNDDICLQVADTGNGIPDSEKRRVFNKFYRIGDEGTRRTKGTGLGLYLTSKIVTQHKARISIKDNMPHGAVFTITLPRWDA
jgi:signal transduction histidine kinase